METYLRTLAASREKGSEQLEQHLADTKARRQEQCESEARAEAWAAKVMDTGIRINPTLSAMFGTGMVPHALTAHAPPFSGRPTTATRTPPAGTSPHQGLSPSVRVDCPSSSAAFSSAAFDRGDYDHQLDAAISTAQSAAQSPASFAAPSSITASSFVSPPPQINASVDHGVAAPSGPSVSARIHSCNSANSQSQLPMAFAQPLPTGHGTGYAGHLSGYSYPNLQYLQHGQQNVQHWQQTAHLPTPSYYMPVRNPDGTLLFGSHSVHQPSMVVPLATQQPYSGCAAGYPPYAYHNSYSMPPGNLPSAVEGNASMLQLASYSLFIYFQ